MATENVILLNLQENSTNAESDKPKNAGFTTPNPLSKKQMKKRAKLLKYEETKRERRKREKERQKQRRIEAKAKGLTVNTGPTRKVIKKRLEVARSNESALNVIIDLDFDNLMLELDIAKCVKQCLRIYTINRRAVLPAHLHFTGIKLDGHIHEAFKKNHGWENWHVNYHFEKTHLHVFPTDKIVYLTCEADEVLESLTPEQVYVIGGLVDHNHHKGLCQERALKSGLKTARLPLSEHVDMKTRSVLSTFHVFEILLRVSEGKSWTEAILQTIPARKGAKPKQHCTAEPEDKTITEAVLKDS